MTNPRDDLFQWPLIGAEEEKAVLEQLRKPNYSDDEIVPAFEHEFAERLGTDYAIAESSGTNAILAALFGCGVGRGDEVIVPTSSPPCLYCVRLHIAPVRRGLRR